MKHKDFNSVIDLYFETKRSIHEYFGYSPDWVEIPLEDRREMFWMICGSENDRSTISYSNEPFTKEMIEVGEKLYSDTLYTQRFLPKYVYRTEKLVLISVDTHTDGNKFLAIYDTAKECKDEELKQLAKECWG